MTGRPPAVDADAGKALAGFLSAARGSSPPDAATALAALSAARRLAADLERGELALIEAARSGGASWSQVSAALGARNRQTAQKRHADLARRRPRPPSADIPQAQPSPGPPAAKPGSRQPEATPPAGEDAPASAGQLQVTLASAAPATPPGKPATPRRCTAIPGITGEVIAESRYELARAPDYAETRAWLVLVGGRAAGLIRPTWHGERSKAAWEPVDLSGLPLPVKGTGRVTPAGNARTRDAAAVSLLRALQRQQEQQQKKPQAAPPGQGRTTTPLTAAAGGRPRHGRRGNEGSAHPR